MLGNPLFNKSTTTGFVEAALVISYPDTVVFVTSVNVPAPLFFKNCIADLIEAVMLLLMLIINALSTPDPSKSNLTIRIALLPPEIPIYSGRFKIGVGKVDR